MSSRRTFSSSRWAAAWFSRGLALGIVCAIPTSRAGENAAPRAQKNDATAGAAAVNRVIPGLDLELVWIQPGTFTMGSAPEEADRNKAEGPQTVVTLTHGFWLGKTPVTQQQYAVLAGENPSDFKAAGPSAPVERVSWNDAMAWCAQLTEKERAAGRLPEGFVYSLPTEAQWEYACRAGTTGPFAGEPDALAWYDRNSGGTTHPVGLKKANAWGLHDMLGNVLEWCYDWYGDYRGGEVSDPSGPGSGYFRMARGGSWRMNVLVCRSAARSGGSPDRRDYTLGFRLALRVAPQ